MCQKRSSWLDEGGHFESAKVRRERRDVELMNDGEKDTGQSATEDQDVGQPTAEAVNFEFIDGAGILR
jgi:hypothetical protein